MGDGRCRDCGEDVLDRWGKRCADCEIARVREERDEAQSRIAELEAQLAQAQAELQAEQELGSNAIAEVRQLLGLPVDASNAATHQAVIDLQERATRAEAAEAQVAALQQRGDELHNAAQRARSEGSWSYGSELQRWAEVAVKADQIAKPYLAAQRYCGLRWRDTCALYPEKSQEQVDAWLEWLAAAGHTF